MMPLTRNKQSNLLRAIDALKYGSLIINEAYWFLTTHDANPKFAEEVCKIKEKLVKLGLAVQAAEEKESNNEEK